MTLLSSLRLIPGMVVRRNDKRYRIVDLLNATDVIAESDDGKRDKYRATEFLPDLDVLSPEQPNLVNVEAKQWQRAIEIYDLIQPLVDKGSERTRSDVEKIALKADKHLATVYRWLSDYESTGLVSSLIRSPRADRGKKRLDPEVEKTIQETIEKFYLTEQRKSPAKTAYEARKICKQKGLMPPDIATVRSRIFEISEESRVRRREGGKIARERFQEIRGHFPNANFPLAVAQIDHTPVDAIIVDDVHRKPIGRAHLTLAIDVFSKMVLGFCMSIDNPGALSTGLCLSNAILGKEIYLSRLGLDHLTWPCWGVMRTIHTDNAKEFRGTMMGKAATEYGVIAERRPRGLPQYGGHIERSFRTYMDEVHNEIPGTTFSNVQDKLEYDSEGRAIMTMDALEKWFTIFLLGVYHQRPHQGNKGLPPIAKWEQGVFGSGELIGSGIPMRVPDEDRLRLDFMPYFERTVQEYGIQIEGISYWTDALRRFIHAKDAASTKQKALFICRYDPRNLSKIWMFDADSNKYIEIPYRDISRPAISIWELREAKRVLREQSYSATNEELIFKSIDDMRAIVEEEAVKTKSARRKQQRRKQWASAPDITKKASSNAQKTIESKEMADHDADMDLFEPFDGIRESE